MSLLFSMWTVLVAVVFVSIVIWVLRQDKAEFDEAAQIPFEETDEPLLKEKESGENNHG
jgi:cbb3-type cytochrome oxidase subunit 3